MFLNSFLKFWIVNTTTAQFKRQERKNPQTPATFCAHDTIQVHSPWAVVNKPESDPLLNVSHSYIYNIDVRLSY